MSRLGLPSGGWWELVTRPRWGQVRRWARCASDLRDDTHFVERVLASLTPAWSFDEEIDPEAVARREPGDLAAVLKALQSEIVPAMGVNDRERMAEELFAGLVSGRLPAGFIEVHLIAATGWSWQALQETPADVVEKMAIYLAVTEAHRLGASLDLDWSFGEEREAVSYGR